MYKKVLSIISIFVFVTAFNLNFAGLNNSNTSNWNLSLDNLSSLLFTSAKAGCWNAPTSNCEHYDLPSGGLWVCQEGYPNRNCLGT